MCLYIWDFMVHAYCCRLLTGKAKGRRGATAAETQGRVDGKAVSDSTCVEIVLRLS